MNVGMLWYDDDKKRSLEERVRRAADYYRRKYGRVPTRCFVHPAALAAGTSEAAGMRIEASANVLPNHIWLGVEDAG